MKLFYVFILCMLSLSKSWAAFYDCTQELAELKSDIDALAKIKAAYEQKYKFSSSCLEIVLRKNFF